jgi:peptidoglycan/LPS O-acetylase OafA/YrhL
VARVSYDMYLIHPFVLFAVLTGLARWVLPNEVGAPLLGALSAVVLLATWLGACAMFVLLERARCSTWARAGAGACARGQGAADGRRAAHAAACWRAQPPFRRK